ncbi:MAG: LacI family transcriptional regulator [Phycisphaerales bacterium]|nr:LacI family transcriptional regulator [Phycisphaerales bacterium]
MAGGANGTEKRLVRPQRKRVTLADVAAKAGVSVATASVAITGRPSGNCRVSAEVAERIRAAARALNYRPNIQARSLSTQRTHTIAMLIKRAAWHNAMSYVSAMQRLLRKAGYTEMFMLHPDNLLETEREQLEMCIQRRVEGIVTLPLIDLDGRANVELLNQIQQEEGIPIVQLGLALDGCVAPSIVADDVEGMRSAVRLLHAMGHRNIAYVTIAGFDNTNAFNPFRQAHLRYLGYRKGLDELGLAEAVFCGRGDCTEVEFLYDRGFEVAKAFAAAVNGAGNTRRPTAAITFSDFTAAGLVAGLLDAGIKVPDQVSVLGVGDQPFARMLRPALSTLAPPFERMGELATQTLLKMIDGGGAGESAAIPPSLVMRDTVRAIEAGT